MAKQSRPSAGSAQSRQRAAARQATERRARRIRIGVIGGGVAALAAVIALFAVTATSGGASGVSDPTRFDLPSLHGTGRVRLADFRGKPVVVNMFASWCTVCRSELTGFAGEARRLAGQVVFIEVDSQETGDGSGMAADFHLAEAGTILAKDIGPSPASRLHDAVGAQGMPVSIFYDARGNLLEHDNAGILEPDLGNKLQQLYGV